MDSLNKLIQLLQNDEQIKRFKELEAIIDQNYQIQVVYKKLLNAQKYMVQQQHTNPSLYEDAQKAYEDVYEELLSFVVMQEYLDLLDAINYDLNMIQNIIESEINIDLD